MNVIRMPVTAYRRQAGLPARRDPDLDQLRRGKDHSKIRLSSTATRYLDTMPRDHISTCIVKKGYKGYRTNNISHLSPPDIDQSRQAALGKCVDTVADAVF